MEQFVLIGEKLGHSLSVPIHTMLFEQMGWPGAYRLMEIPKENVHQAGKTMRLMGLRGMNVTIPYKLDIIPQLDEVDDLARQVGAVNTVLNQNGKLIGYNTDVYGLTAMLERQGPCAVLGSGGAARCAVVALRQMGAPHVTVISRRPHAGESWGDQVTFAGYESLENMTGGLLINATPVGMHPYPDACPVTAQQLKGFDGCADLIYNPSETRFIKLAEQMKIPACTGLYMLVAQAMKAEEIWWRRAVPAPVTEAIYQRMLKEMNP